MTNTVFLNSITSTNEEQVDKQQSQSLMPNQKFNVSTMQFLANLTTFSDKKIEYLILVTLLSSNQSKR